GLDLADVVKATVYLTDMADFAAYNEVWREYFPSDPPTRATIGVSALAIGARCEVEVVAAR
ncbi:MAG TPA: RidA family protein, partial [Candidatus Limnocylindrales bacterium]